MILSILVFILIIKTFSFQVTNIENDVKDYLNILKVEQDGFCSDEICQDIRKWLSNKILKPEYQLKFEFIRNRTINMIEYYNGRLQNTKIVDIKQNGQNIVVRTLDFLNKNDWKRLRESYHKSRNKKFKITVALKLEPRTNIEIKCPIDKKSNKKYQWLVDYYASKANNMKILIETTKSVIFDSFEEIQAKNLSKNSDQRIFYFNNSLFIKDFKKKDAGVYICLEIEHYKDLMKYINSNESIDLLKLKKLSFLSAYNLNSYFQDFLKDTNNANILDKSYNHLKKEILLELVFRFSFNLFFSFKQNNVRLPVSREIEPTFKDYGSMPRDYFLKDEKVKLYTSWKEWSECNSCDKSGVRKREGDCRAYYKSNDNSNINGLFSYLQRIFYPIGWPCYITYDYIPFIELFKLEKDYILNDFIEYESCKVPCVNYLEVFSK
jgi:hypothetical protein